MRLRREYCESRSQKREERKGREEERRGEERRGEKYMAHTQRTHTHTEHTHTVDFYSAIKQRDVIFRELDRIMIIWEEEGDQWERRTGKENGGEYG